MSLRFNPVIPVAKTALSQDGKLDRILDTLTSVQVTMNNVLLQKNSVSAGLQFLTDNCAHINAGMTYLTTSMNSVMSSQTNQLYFANTAANLLGASHPDGSPFSNNVGYGCNTILAQTIPDPLGSQLSTGVASLISANNLSSYGKTTVLENAIIFVLQILNNNSGFRAGLSLSPPSSAPNLDVMSANIYRLLHGDFTAAYDVGGVFLFPLALQVKFIVQKFFLSNWPSIFST